MIQNKLNTVSLIDLFASALAAAVMLMLVFAINNQKKSGSKAPAGPPRDFLFYRIEVYDLNARIFPLIKPPGGEWIKIKKKNQETRPRYYPNDMLMLEPYRKELFAWGPAYDTDKNSYTYYVYGTSSEIGNWEVGILFSHRAEYDEGVLDIPSVNHQKILQAKAKVFCRIRTRTIKEKDTTFQVPFGQYRIWDFDIDQTDE